MVVSTWLCILAVLAFCMMGSAVPVLSFGFAVRTGAGGTCGVVIRRREGEVIREAVVPLWRCEEPSGERGRD